MQTAPTRVLLVGLALLLCICWLTNFTTSTTSTCSCPDTSTNSKPKRIGKQRITYVNAGDDDDNSTLPIITVTASTIDTFGALSEIPKVIRKSIRIVPKTFNNATGPTNKVMAHRGKFDGKKDGKKKRKCVACRLNCMNLEVFAACERRYHMYGCKATAPCITEKTAKNKDIKKAVGICVKRNGCILKKLKNMFKYRVERDRDGKEVRIKVRILPKLDRVIARVRKYAHDISAE